METKKKRLSILIVLAMIVTMLTGLTVNAAAEDETIYLAFTSDVHCDAAHDPNNLDIWLGNMNNVVEKVEYMGVCGDIGSAYASTTDAYWENVQAAMDTADSYVDSGFIANDAIFTFGNHEWYTFGGGDYAKNEDIEIAQRIIGIGEAVKTDDYIIYCFGAEGTTEHYGCAQQYSDESIATIKAYLETAPTDIPIIIMTHFPIHTFSTRVTENGDALLEALNNYPNVIYLWGHNHSNSDTYYDKFYTAGDEIEVTAAKTMTKIGFTYCAAGCMADEEYNPQSASVKGKGLLMAINGSDVTLEYYDMDGNNLEGSITIPASGSPISEDEPAEPDVEPGSYDIRRTSMTIKVNDDVKAIEAYNIDGSTYLKLRDVAYTLNGTGSQFLVDYDDETKTITCVTGAAYSPDGTELQIGEDKSAVGKPSSQSLIIDGESSELTAFIFDGNNYLKLRELGTAFKFDVDYDDATRTVLINSREASGETGETETADKGDAAGTVYFFGVTDNDILMDTEGNEIVYYPISIYDGDTIADAITNLHQQAYGDGSAWGYEETSSYGFVLNKLMGVECGNVSYGGGLWTDFSEGKHCDPNDPAEDGMNIYLNNFTDGTNNIYFRCGFFDKQYVELFAGEAVTLTFNRCSGDGTVKACSSSEVSVNGESKGNTDGSGTIEITFDAPGEYIVKGTGVNSYTCAVCYVVVK